MEGRAVWFRVQERTVKTERLSVRFWLEADIHPHSDLRPLYPRKQTSRKRLQYVCL